MQTMEWSPKLNRQRTAACPGALDIGSWCDGSRSGCFGFSRRYVEVKYDEEEYMPARTTGPRWRGLWRRIVRGKRRIFATAPVHIPYDPYTYAQNFDEGLTWVEPEDLSRSFSVRFANPSELLRSIG